MTKNHHTDGDVSAEMFSAILAFAYEIEIEEGDVTTEDSLAVEYTIVQSWPVSVAYGDGT